MNAILATEIERLSPAEKLHLAEDLFESIAKESNEIKTPAWHDKALAEDAAKYAADRSSGDSWDNVKRRVAKANDPLPIAIGP